MKLKLSWKGCLIGCGSVVGLIIVMSFFSVFWLTRKQAFEPGGTVLHDDATIYLRANFRREDMVLIQFLTTQASRLSEINPAYGNFPSILHELKVSKTDHDIRKLLPLEIELADKASENDLRGSVGFSVYNGAAKVAFWFFKRDAAKQKNLHEYHGIEYIMLPDTADDPFWICLSKNIFYYARTEEGLRTMLDKATPVDTSTDPRLADVDLSAPFYGFAIEGSIHHMLETFEQDINATISDAYTEEELAAAEELEARLTTTIDTLLDNLRRIAFDMSLKDEETLTGNLIFDMPVSSEMQQSVEMLLKQLFEQKQLEITYRIIEREGGYKTSFEVTGFQKAVRELQGRLEELEKLEDTSELPPEEPLEPLPPPPQN